MLNRQGKKESLFSVSIFSENQKLCVLYMYITRYGVIFMQDFFLRGDKFCWFFLANFITQNRPYMLSVHNFRFSILPYIIMMSDLFFSSVLVNFRTIIRVYRYFYVFVNDLLHKHMTMKALITLRWCILICIFIWHLIAYTLCELQILHHSSYM